MIRMSLQISNIARVRAELRAVPKQIERASTNAKNATGTYGRRRFINRAASTLGVRKRPLGRATQVKRVSRRSRRDSAIVRTKAVRLPIRFWRWRFIPIDGTRAAVEVQDGLNGEWQRAYAFVNPRGKGQVPLARYPNSASSTQAIENRTVVELRTRQLLVIGGRGVTLKRPFAQWATDRSTQAEIGKELERQFSRKLDDQIRKGRR